MTIWSFSVEFWTKVRDLLWGTPLPVSVTGLGTPIYGTTLVLMAGFTPGGTGAMAAEFLVPAAPDGSSKVWNVGTLTARVRVAGGAPAMSLEQSAGGGAFSLASTPATLTLSTDAYEGSSAGSGTVTTGDLLRLNVTALGTATDWTVTISLT